MLNAYTLPAFELSFRALRPGVVRLYQRYTVPKPVKLELAHALLPRARAARKRASMRKTGELERIKAGRYTSQVTVTLPDGLERRLPLRELLPADAGHGDGRSRTPPCPKLRLAVLADSAHIVVRS